jgi:mRNA interferase RelE/StbE
MAKVQLTSEAKEDVRDLDGDARKRVLKALKKLEDGPSQRGQPLGSNPTGDLTSFRKLVVGNRQFRVIYRVEMDGTVVVVWVVGARTDDECYQMAVSRLKLYTSNSELADELEQLLQSAWASQQGA